MATTGCSFNAFQTAQGLRSHVEKSLPKRKIAWVEASSDAVPFNKEFSIPPKKEIVFSHKFQLLLKIATFKLSKGYSGRWTSSLDARRLAETILDGVLTHKVLLSETFRQSIQKGSSRNFEGKSLDDFATVLLGLKNGNRAQKNEFEAIIERLKAKITKIKNSEGILGVLENVWVLPKDDYRYQNLPKFEGAYETEWASATPHYMDSPKVSVLSRSVELVGDHLVSTIEAENAKKEKRTFVVHENGSVLVLRAPTGEGHKKAKRKQDARVDAFKAGIAFKPGARLGAWTTYVPEDQLFEDDSEIHNRSQIEKTVFVNPKEMFSPMRDLIKKVKTTENKGLAIATLEQNVLDILEAAGLIQTQLRDNTVRYMRIVGKIEDFQKELVNVLLSDTIAGVLLPLGVNLSKIPDAVKQISESISVHLVRKHPSRFHDSKPHLLMASVDAIRKALSEKYPSAKLVLADSGKWDIENGDNEQFLMQLDALNRFTKELTTRRTAKSSVDDIREALLVDRPTPLVAEESSTSLLVKSAVALTVAGGLGLMFQDLDMALKAGMYTMAMLTASGSGTGSAKMKQFMYFIMVMGMVLGAHSVRGRGAAMAEDVKSRRLTDSLTEDISAKCTAFPEDVSIYPYIRDGEVLDALTSLRGATEVFNPEFITALNNVDCEGGDSYTLNAALRTALINPSAVFNAEKAEAIASGTTTAKAVLKSILPALADVTGHTVDETCILPPSITGVNAEQCEALTRLFSQISYPEDLLEQQRCLYNSDGSIKTPAQQVSYINGFFGELASHGIPSGDMRAGKDTPNQLVGLYCVNNGTVTPPDDDSSSAGGSFTSHFNYDCADRACYGTRAQFQAAEKDYFAAVKSLYQLTHPEVTVLPSFDEMATNLQTKIDLSNIAISTKDIEKQTADFIAKAKVFEESSAAVAKQGLNLGSFDLNYQHNGTAGNGATSLDGYLVYETAPAQTRKFWIMKDATNLVTLEEFQAVQGDFESALQTVNQSKALVSKNVQTLLSLSSGDEVPGYFSDPNAFRYASEYHLFNESSDSFGDQYARYSYLSTVDVTKAVSEKQAFDSASQYAASITELAQGANVTYLSDNSQRIIQAASQFKSPDGENYTLAQYRVDIGNLTQKNLEDIQLEIGRHAEALQKSQQIIQLIKDCPDLAQSKSLSPEDKQLLNAASLFSQPLSATYTKENHTTDVNVILDDLFGTTSLGIQAARCVDNAHTYDGISAMATTLNLTTGHEDSIALNDSLKTSLGNASRAQIILNGFVGANTQVAKANFVASLTPQERIKLEIAISNVVEEKQQHSLKIADFNVSIKTPIQSVLNLSLSNVSTSEAVKLVGFLVKRSISEADATQLVSDYINAVRPQLNPNDKILKVVESPYYSVLKDIVSHWNTLIESDAQSAKIDRATEISERLAGIRNSSGNTSSNTGTGNGSNITDGSGGRRLTPLLRGAKALAVSNPISTVLDAETLARTIKTKEGMDWAEETADNLDTYSNLAGKILAALAGVGIVGGVIYKIFSNTKDIDNLEATKGLEALEEAIDKLERKLKGDRYFERLARRVVETKADTGIVDSIGNVTEENKNLAAIEVLRKIVEQKRIQIEKRTQVATYLPLVPYERSLAIHYGKPLLSRVDGREKLEFSNAEIQNRIGQMGEKISLTQGTLHGLRTVRVSYDTARSGIDSSVSIALAQDIVTVVFRTILDQFSECTEAQGISDKKKKLIEDLGVIVLKTEAVPGRKCKRGEKGFGRVVSEFEPDKTSGWCCGTKRGKRPSTPRAQQPRRQTASRATIRPETCGLLESTPSKVVGSPMPGPARKNFRMVDKTLLGSLRAKGDCPEGIKWLLEQVQAACQSESKPSAMPAAHATISASDVIMRPSIERSVEESWNELLQKLVLPSATDIRQNLVDIGIDSEALVTLFHNSYITNQKITTESEQVAFNTLFSRVDL